MHNEKDIVIDPVIDDFQSYLSRQQMERARRSKWLLSVKHPSVNTQLFQAVVFVYR